MHTRAIGATRYAATKLRHLEFAYFQFQTCLVTTAQSQFFQIRYIIKTTIHRRFVVPYPVVVLRSICPESPEDDEDGPAAKSEKGGAVG